jgi:hypothetical protein
MPAELGKKDSFVRIALDSYYLSREKAAGFRD